MASIANAISSFFSNNTAKNQYTFNIYENASLDDTDGLTGNTAIQFTGFISQGYTGQVNIAYETLEGGNFTNDSIQYIPFNVSIIAVLAPLADGTLAIGDQANNATNLILTCYNQIETYRLNTTLLTILSQSPIYKTYPNVKIVQFEQLPVSAKLRMLVARITFQQIRISDTNSGLSTSTVANPEYSDIQNNGYTNTYSVTNSNVTIDTLNNSFINSNLV